MPRLYASDKGHVYKLDDVKIPSVTTILNALPKSLQQWAADQAANHAVEHWQELSELPITKRVDRIRYAHREVVNRAAVRGTEIHKFGELVSRGEGHRVPDEHRGPVEAYARFLDEWDIDVEVTEAPLCNVSQRYAGRLDMIGRIGKRDNVRALIDLKTGNAIYESVVLQLAGYNGAEIWQPNGPASEGPYQPVDAMYVAHIRPDTVEMRPVAMGQFRAFQYVQQVSRWLDAHGYKGDEPLVGPGERP